MYQYSGAASVLCCSTWPLPLLYRRGCKNGGPGLSCLILQLARSVSLASVCLDLSYIYNFLYNVSERSIFSLAISDLVIIWFRVWTYRLACGVRLVYTDV